MYRCLKLRFKRNIEIPLNILASKEMSTIDLMPIFKRKKAEQEEEKLCTTKKKRTARSNFYKNQELAKTNTHIDNIKVLVLGSGAVGAPKSLYMVSKGMSYLFNCGDSCKRLTAQLTVKPKKLQAIFVTQSVWENIGGITALMLLLDGSGIPELNIHGPPGVDSSLNATANFTQITQLKPLVHNLTEEGVYDDGILKIKYFPIYATETSNNKNTEKYFLKLPKKKLLQEEAVLGEKITTIENHCSFEKDENLENPLLGKIDEINNKKLPEKEMIEDNRNYTHFEQKMSLCYVCRLPIMLGQLDLDACVERNVPAGPLFRKLKNGEDIELPDGRVVRYQDVTTPDTPGRTFLIIDCPSVDYIDSLIQNEGLNENRVATEPREKIIVAHFSPPSVMNHPKYKEWMKSFQNGTHHLRLNEDNTCIGTPPISHRLQTKLNLIHPVIFPPLAKGPIPIKTITEGLEMKAKDAVSPSLLYAEESSREINEKEDNNKIIIGTTMLTINLKKFNIFRDRNYYLCPEEYIGEAFQEPGAKEAFEELRQKVKEFESSINSTTDGEYPKIIFLGTGSGSPDLLRNASGILVFTSPDSCMLLDCGESTYDQMIKLFGTDKVNEIMLKLKAVFVSHIHADHHLGFIGLIKGRRRAIDKYLEKQCDLFKDENLTKSEMIDKLNIRPLFLIAPSWIKNYLKLYHLNVEHILEDFNLISSAYFYHSSKGFMDKMQSKVTQVPLPNIKFFLSDCNLMEFKTSPVRHGGKAYGASLITNSGYKITYSGDTMPCQALIQLGFGSDLLIHEATMDSDLAADAAKKQHSTISQAVDVGQQMKAKHIILTHFSQRYSHMPRFTKTLPDNVGIAFDNMVVSMKQLPLLPKFLPVMRLFFAEDLKYLENRQNRVDYALRRKTDFFEKEFGEVTEAGAKEEKVQVLEKEIKAGNRKTSTVNSLFISKAKRAKQEKEKLLNIMDNMKVDQNLNPNQKHTRDKYYIKKEWAKTNTNISNIMIYVVGNGAIGTPKSLYLSTDNKGYLFNCGDSCQRLTTQLKLKLIKLQDIFVTQSVWENIGGITGLMLSLQEAGIPELDIHGPPGVDSLLNATANFTQIRKLKPLVHNLTEEGVYDDGIMKIKYFPIYPSETSNNNNTEKYFLKLPKKMLLQDEADLGEKITTIENYCSSEQDYYQYLDNLPVENTDESSDDEEVTENEMVQNNRNYTHFEQKMSMCYVCRSPNIIGSLDLEACVERNVPPGPLFGKLKNKQDIELPDGSVVRYQDVLNPDTPGTTFLIIDCPSVDYIDSLIQNEGLNKNRTATEPGEKIMLVVHFSPPSVMNHPKYIEWIKGFQNDTHHLRLNEDNTCIGTPASHRLQTKLNLIHPAIFQPLAKDVIPTKKKNEELVSPSLLHVEEPSSEKEDNNKIIIGTTMLTINLKKFNIFRDPNYYLCPEDYIEEAFAEKGAKEALVELKQEVKELESSINSTTDGDYPKVIFLGTGSSAPQNARNTSGILVFTSPNTCILLDCGEGTYDQIVRLFGRDQVDEIMLKLRAVYVSHLHADHHLGFIGLIKGRRRAIDTFLKKHSDLFKDENLTKSEMVDKLNIRPLYLVAPPNISSYLKTYDSDVENILEDFNLISNGVLKILYYLDKPEYIRIKKRSKVRVVPVPDIIKFFLSDCNLTQFKTCHVRHCYNSYGTTFITNSGYKITYSGDTMPCGALIEIGLGSDLLIHEATMDNDRATDAAKKLHSTIGQAVDVGEQMKAKNVILTHFSQRYAYIPRYTETLPDNVGIAFDYMMVSMKQLPLLPKFLTVMRLFFADQLRYLEGKLIKDQAKDRFFRKRRIEEGQQLQKKMAKE